LVFGAIAGDWTFGSGVETLATIHSTEIRSCNQNTRMNAKGSSNMPSISSVELDYTNVMIDRLHDGRLSA